MMFANRQTYRKQSGIYQIRNIVNEKVYIGQTKQPFYKRFLHHVWKLRNGTHDNFTQKKPLSLKFLKSLKILLCLTKKKSFTSKMLAKPILATIFPTEDKDAMACLCLNM